MTIYTKTGDNGYTSLADGTRVSKADVRIDTYGTSDELNSWVGLLRASLRNEDGILEETDRQLHFLQNKLFNLGAELSLASGDWIEMSDVCQLEGWIDAMQAHLPRQRAFILPVGGHSVSVCQICRTICRRLERKMIVLGVKKDSLVFVNRMSDYLFVLARYIGFVKGETEEVWSK